MSKAWTHQFDEGFACQHGVIAAVIYERICWWVRHNAANGTNLHDGRYWTHNTVKAWTDQMPFFSEKQIRVGLDKLRTVGAVVTGVYNANRFDRELWYSPEEAFALEGNSDLPCGANGSVPEGNTSITVLDKTETTTLAVALRAPAVKSSYRRFTDLFVERDGHKWAVGGKEGASMARLVKWAKAEQPARWEEYLQAFMDGAWALRRGELVGMRDFDKRRWASMPYTPSALLNQSAAIVTALETIQAKPIDAQAYADAAVAGALQRIAARKAAG